jgi:hypothetical protein
MKKKGRPSFFTYTLRFGLVFLIIITLIKVIIALFDVGFSGAVQKYFAHDTWFNFVKVQVIMSLFYGLFMAGYYTFFKKK